MKDLLSNKPSYEKVEKLKAGTLDIVGLVGASQRQPQQPEITLPLPKSDGRPLDIRISSEEVPELLTKKESHYPIEGVKKDEHIIVHLQDRSASEEPSSEAQDRKAAIPLKLSFTQAELEAYVAYRSEGLAAKSKDWITRSSEALWKSTGGDISHQSMTGLRTFVLDKYTSADSHSKVLSFVAGFLKFLAQTNIDPRYLSFTLFLERPKSKKVKKALTERIITRDEINSLLQHITVAGEQGTDPMKIRNYRALTLLASYTGLRPSTIQRLTVGQFRTALSEEKPVLHVLAEQEKNRVEHYVPLHPVVVGSISDVLEHDFDEKDNAKPFFIFFSFEKWLKRQKIPLPRVRDSKKAFLWPSDFRKFAEQFGDVIGWDTTNRKYVLAHGMTGVDWEHYKHPLPEDVVDIYMESWGDVNLTKNDVR